VVQVARGHGVGIIIAVSVALAGVGERTAVAGHDLVRTFEFVGFSVDASRFLLLVNDEQTGYFFSLRSFDSGKQVKSQYVENPQDIEKTKKEIMAKFNIVPSHVSSLKSPDGRFSLVGVQEGRRFKVLVLQGKKTAVLKTIDCEHGSTGVAQASLKNAHWTKDGRKVVVIVHKVLRDENGIDADEALPVLFLPSSLRFE
jgi:hypothetical protein